MLWLCHNFHDLFLLHVSEDENLFSFRYKVYSVFLSFYMESKIFFSKIKTIYLLIYITDHMEWLTLKRSVMTLTSFVNRVLQCDDLFYINFLLFS